MTDRSIKILIARLKKAGLKLPLTTDPLLLLAKGTDAGFYRLIPQLVIEVNNEIEIIKVLKFCHELKIPITFRAGGTSLSGQTVTRSVLVETGPRFSGHNIADQGEKATFQPGIRGGYANLLLSRFGRKIGPSPASINAAKIGGIVANNASGSSYGITTNSYNTIHSMRIVFADGTLLDTGDLQSRESFLHRNRELVGKIIAIRDKTLNDPATSEKIRSKYRLKIPVATG